MRHLNPLEIDELNNGEAVTRDTREHFANCNICQQRVAQAERMERVLNGLGRAEPAADLSARIIATLPQQARGPQTNGWLGAATVLAALLGFGMAYQTALTLGTNGAFELVSYYTAQPEIVTTYPNEAWGALAAAVPWVTVAISLVMLAVALVLTYRWTGRSARVMG